MPDAHLAPSPALTPVASAPEPKPFSANGFAPDAQAPGSPAPFSPSPEEEPSYSSESSSLPDDFYSTLQPPPDMDDLDSPMMTSEIMDLPAEPPPDAEEEHHGMRRPTLDEFDKLKNHPYVQRVNNVFHTTIVDARLKN